MSLPYHACVTQDARDCTSGGQAGGHALRTLCWLGEDQHSYLHVRLRSDGAVATNERAANLSEAVRWKGHKQGAARVFKAGARNSRVLLPLS